MRAFVALVVVLAACDQGASTPAPVPAPTRPVPAPPPPTPPTPPTPPPIQPAPPPPPPAPRPHTQSRRTTQLEDALPRHGITLHEYGLGGDDLVVIDSDAKTLRYIEHPSFNDRKPKNSARKLGDSELAKLAALADAAWRENPVGHTPSVTDARSYLQIGDGDDVFVANGTVFEAPWRPAGGKLVEAIIAASSGRDAH
jgi:hypothetical protein